MRLLVIEDDPRTAGFVVQGLQQSGFAVDHCADGETGLQLALSTMYDAAIVDLMRTKLDGCALVQKLRAEKSSVPVLILSANGDVEDRIRGLEKGGDDYLVKPFAMAELTARVHALIRRAMHPSEASVLTVANLKLDLFRREVTRAGRKIELHRREFALLEYLLRSRGRTVTKMMILEHVWDYSLEPQTNVVDVLIYRLRQKIEKGFEPKLIQTVKGRGYAVGAH